MAKTLASDATVADVRNTVGNPDRYYSNLLQIMRRTTKERGPCVVRMGVTGTGATPNFRIDSIDGSWTAGAFDGGLFKTFKELGSGTQDRETWSTRGSTIEDVTSILVGLRSYSAIANRG